MKRTSLLLLPAAVLLATLSACGALDGSRRAGPRILDAELGLDGVIRTGRWATARVDVGHPGPQPFEGTVEVAAEGLQRGAFSVAVHLAAGARQRIVVPFLVPTTGVSVELRDHRGRLVDAPEVRTRIVGDEEMVVAVLGSVPAGLRRLAAQKTERPQVIVAALDPSRAPPLAQGYEPADLVLWPEPSPGALDQAARTAALDHLRGGGRWLITLGDGWRELERSAWQPLLPARPVELETLDLDAAALATLAMGPARGAAGARLNVVTLEPRDGASVLVRMPGQGARPLLVQRAAGLGELTLLAVRASEPGRTESAGAAAAAAAAGAAAGPGSQPGQLWRALLGAARSDSNQLPRLQAAFDSRALPVNRHALSSAHARLTSALEADLKVPPLSLAGVLLALVVYLLVIGPIDYLVLKRLDRLEWTWVTYPVAVLIFAVGVTVWGQSSRGSQTLATRVDYVDLLEPSGRHRVRSHLAIYTPSKAERRLMIRHAGGQAAPSAIAGQRTSGARLQRAHLDGPEPYALLSTHASAISFIEARWTAETLGERTTGDGSGAQASGAPGAGQPLLRLRREGSEALAVESHLPFPLDGAWLVTPEGRSLALGRLAPGDTARVSLTAEASTADPVKLGELALGAGHPPVTHGETPTRPRPPGSYLLLGHRNSVAPDLFLDGAPLGGRGQTLLRAPLWPGDDPTSDSSDGVTR